MHPQPAYGFFGFSAHLRNPQGFEQQYAHFVRRKSDSRDNSCRGKHGERDKRERKPPDKSKTIADNVIEHERRNMQQVNAECGGCKQNGKFGELAAGLKTGKSD